MTIETQTNKVQYAGNGLTTDFPVPFPVQDAGHLKLFLWLDGRQTRLAGGFTVLGAGTARVSVRTSEPVAPGARLTIIREVPLVQPMALSNSGPFNAGILEDSADNLAMQIQQLKEEIGRAVVAPESLNAGEVTYLALAELLSASEAAPGFISVNEEGEMAVIGPLPVKLGGTGAKTPARARTALGIPRAATQAEVNAGTADNKFVSPRTLAGIQAPADAGKLDLSAYGEDAPLRVKAWGHINAQGAIVAGQNLTAAARTGTGRFTVYSPAIKPHSCIVASSYMEGTYFANVLGHTVTDGQATIGTMHVSGSYNSAFTFIVL